MDTLEQKKKPTKPVAEEGAAKKPLRARPSKGEVDWAELSREHIRRYPKIRGRLAE